jgi:hypothetical protein
MTGNEVPTMSETFKPVDFCDVHAGDAVSFSRRDNGFDGSGDILRRTGVVIKVTDKTVTVECSDSWGRTGVLRRANWHERSVNRVRTADRRPYRAESVQVVDMGHTVWALYIPDPEQAKDPRHVAENILDRSKYDDVEMIASMTRQYKRDGGAVSGWIVDGAGGWGDGVPNKRQAMIGLRAVIRDHFAR